MEGQSHSLWVLWSQMTVVSAANLHFWLTPQFCYILCKHRAIVAGPIDCYVLSKVRQKSRQATTEPVRRSAINVSLIWRQRIRGQELARHPWVSLMTYRVPAHVRYHPLHDEMVVFDARVDSYVSLNRSATVTWQVLSAGGSSDQAAASLVARFEVPQEQAAAAVAALVSEFTRQGLLDLVDE